MKVLSCKTDTTYVVDTDSLQIPNAPQVAVNGAVIGAADTRLRPRRGHSGLQGSCKGKEDRNRKTVTAALMPMAVGGSGGTCYL